jgi:hypothetical protein
MCGVVLMALGEIDARSRRRTLPTKLWPPRRVNDNQVGASDASRLRLSIRQNFHFYWGSERRNATDIRDETCGGRWDLYSYTIAAALQSYERRGTRAI